jgi:hypothetical protein
MMRGGPPHKESLVHKRSLMELSARNALPGVVRRIDSGR